MFFLKAWRCFQQPAFLLLLLGVSSCSSSKAQAPRRVSQVQVSRQFWLAVLHKQDARAYQLLAPEATQTMTPAQFRLAIRPLYEQGKRFGPTISLHKLGMRLGAGQAARYFYDFSFKSDSLRARPQVLLDVTFRDSVATRIFSFGQIPAPQRK